MQTFRRVRAPALALSFAACNFVTGADSIELTSDVGSGGGNSAPAYLVADGITLTSVAIYQGVERVLAKDGMPVNQGVPVVEGRDALVRFFYAVDPGYDKEPVVARLHLGDTEPLELVAPLGAGSSTGALASTLNFDVPGARITSTTSFRAEILQAAAKSSGTNIAAVFPAKDMHPLYAVSPGPSLKLVLVPIAYKADGSSRLPDTSAEQLERYRQTFYKLYPTPAVDIRVEAPLAWNQQVLPNFSGWQELLNALVDARKNSGAKHEEFWYGIVSPSATFEAFCGGGCVAGLSMLGDDPGQAWLRAGIGLGFTGEGATFTAVHEIGHQHGREHAPCGTNQGLDSGFPTNGAVLDAWGFDLITRTLVAPDANKDFMSYCDPAWLTGYTYAALFAHLRTVNSAAMASWIAPSGDGPSRDGSRGDDSRGNDSRDHETYERVSIGHDGKLTWLAPLELDERAHGQAVPVTVGTDDGDALVTGEFFRYSHGGGGLLLVPAPKNRVRSIASRLGRTTR
ncbi:MAG: hypothetical protein EXR75_16565 [Myxococcales bacterium]|nr:hypothetical protein [Myxococcales bacterium]